MLSPGDERATGRAKEDFNTNIKEKKEQMWPKLIVIKISVHIHILQNEKL